MKKITNLIAGLCILLNLSSCADENNTPTPVIPRIYHYTYCVPNADDELTMVLDSVSADIVSISNVPSWLILEQNGSQDNHPVLRVQTTQGEPNLNNESKVTLVLKDGNTVIIQFYQGVNFVPAENSNEEFLTNWENVDTVLLYTDNGFEKTLLPWADRSSTVIPEDIRENIKKKDGWEMAFSTLGSEAERNINYFGLYNKYLGILRVFYFVTDASTNGSEHCFEINLGSNKGSMKYPFYNSLAYSIPTVHSSVNNAMDLCGANYNQTFKTWVTPYSSMSSTTLSLGWTAFDIDISGYVPANVDYLASSESFTISCRTVTNQQISLAGQISADISGKYSSATPAASATSGVSSTLSSLGSMLGDVQNSALAQIEKAVTGSPIDVGFYYAGVACNVASFAYDWIMGDDGLNDQKIDSMPGKIELNMTGDIELNGYIKSFSSNQIAPLTFKTSLFKTTNPNTSVGKGIWNLAEDPIVYIVDDHYFGSNRRINLTVGKDNTYQTYEALDNEMRLISFLDPTTVKLNLNTDIFPDVHDVEVVCYYGVYPNETKGHTLPYRTLMNLKQPTSINLVDRSKVTIGSIYRTTDSGNKMAYHQVDKDSLLSESLDFENSKNQCQMIPQKGSNYQYYGRLLSAGENDGRAFVVDPQVFFPVSADEKTVYDAEIPDFVVSVFVTFKSGGRNFQFTRRFLPQVKLISGNELKSMKEKLEDYVDDSKEHKFINYVNNNMQIGVKHPNAEMQMEKTMKMFEYIYY